MTFTRHERVLITTNIVGISGFVALFLARGNYEFLLYVAVLAGLMTVILLTHRIFHYSIGLLWALTIWSFLHMIGGGMTYADGKVIYTMMIIPIVGDPYNILKYDQVVHFYGFWVSAILAYYILRPSLSASITHARSIIFIVIMVSLGLSAVNEIVEFMATVLVPETNVGGYENTAIDLVANFLGASCAGVYLWITKFSKNRISYINDDPGRIAD
jgi:uncharacterized membrane protein YjdF